MARLQPVLGLIFITLTAYVWSTNRRAIRLRTVAWGFGLQFLFALVVLRTSFGQATLEVVGDRIRRLLSYSMIGSSFSSISVFSHNSLTCLADRFRSMI